MGDEGLRLATDDAMLHVTTSDAGAPSPGWRLVLQPAGEGAVAAPVAPDAWVPDRIVEDLSTVGVDLRYGVAPAAAEASWLLWRDDDTAWPVVSRKEKTIVFWPDPLAGAPSPSETPLWPLFVDNLRRRIMGADLGADGWRVRGLLDIETSELGTRRTDLERVSAMLAGVPADIREERRPLGRPLAIAGLLLLIALWFRTRAVPTPLAAVPSDL
jgi:hypothetical protein